MKIAGTIAAGAAAMFLGSCGGGDGDGGTPPPSNNAPTLNVTLSKQTETIVIEEAGSAAFSFDATYTGTSDDPIVADVAIGDKRYQLAGAPTLSGKTFTVNLATVPFPAGGSLGGEVRFRLCTTAACTTVYPGSTKSVIVTLDVRLKDWSTLQRDAAHRGHLDVVYNHAKFAKSWEFAAQTGAELGTVAAMRDGVFLTEKTTADGKFFAVGLDGTTGIRRWRVDVGTSPTSDPAYFGGKAYYTQTAASGTRAPLAFDALTGAQTTLPAYQTTAGRMNQPVPSGPRLYLIAGSAGRVAHSYNLNNATLLWQRDYGGTVFDKAAMAVDDNNVYAFNGPSLVVLARGSGAVAATFANADFTGGTLWNSAPILDGAGRVFASTRSRDFTDASPLAAWSIATGTRLWLSTELYSTAPALGHQYLFAVNPAQRRVDAIDPATGALAYSLAIPGTAALTGNVVSTRSHVFVSTATDSYAFDIVAAAHPQVWTAAVGGKLAITPDNLLIISSGTKLTAYKLG